MWKVEPIPLRTLFHSQRMGLDLSVLEDEVDLLVARPRRHRAGNSERDRFAVGSWLRTQGRALGAPVCLTEQRDRSTADSPFDPLLEPDFGLRSLLSAWDASSMPRRATRRPCEQVAEGSS